MQLVYFWISKYRNIENIDFNLGCEYKFKFVEQYSAGQDDVTLDLTIASGYLKIEKRDFPLDDFYGSKISNLSAIVGENGSGKSNALSFLIEQLNINYPAGDPFLSIWKDGDKFKICHSQLEISNSEKLDSQFQCLDHRLFNIEIPFIALDCTSSGMEFKPLVNPNYSSDNVINISTIQFVNDFLDPDSPISIHELRSKLYIDDIERILQTVAFLKESCIEHPVKLPQFLKVSYNLFQKNLRDKFDFNNEDLKQGLEIHRKKRIESALVNNFKPFLLIDIIFYFIDLIKLEDKIDDASIDSYMFIETCQEISRFISSDYNDIQLLEKIISQIRQLFSSKESPQSNNTDSFSKHISFTEFLCGQKTIQDLHKSKDSIYFFTDLFKRDTEFFSQLNSLLKYNIKLFSLGLSHESKKSSDGFVSSGELSLLTLLSRINHGLQKKQFQNKDFGVLVIDEPEISLHPQWQKKFIDILVHFLNASILEGKKTQVIITSHSPFFLSDIPTDRVVFLKKGEQEKEMPPVIAHSSSQHPFPTELVTPEFENTFGANIHSLYSSGFFLQKGLIGDFAYRKVNEVISFIKLHDSKISSNEEAKRIIELIGEPVLKNKLNDLLNSKREQESELKYLERRVAEIKNGFKLEVK